MTIKSTLGQILLLVLIGLLVCCGTEKTEHKRLIADNNVDTVFSEFIGSIRKQALPLQITCGLTDNLASLEEFEKFRKYIPKSMDRVFGKFETQDKEYKLVIYGLTGDDIYPFLFSYDTRGQIRDSLSLMLTGCGGADESAIPHSYATLKGDLTIELTDTTRLIHYPEKSESIDDYIVDSLRVSTVTMKLDKDGRFVKQ
jgi:hypothetical protein